MSIDRRMILKGLAASAVVPALAAPQIVRASGTPRVVIVGAGPAGLAVAARLRRALPRADITLCDPSDTLGFKPARLFTAAGLWKEDTTSLPLSDHLPVAATLVPQAVTHIQTATKSVRLGPLTEIPYDYLVIATGLVPDFEAVSGFDSEIVGAHGIGSLYLGDAEAERTRTSLAAFLKTGGLAHFVAPSQIVSGTSAPLAFVLLVADLLERAGTRPRSELFYYVDGNDVYPNPQINDFLLRTFQTKGITVRQRHRLTSLRPAARSAIYETPLGPIEHDYDFIHVVPPAKAPSFLTAHGMTLPANPVVGPFVDVDPARLSLRRHPEIFALGDVAGLATSKTLPAIRAQAAVVADVILAAHSGRAIHARYDGESFFHLPTRIGRLVVGRYDYSREVSAWRGGEDPFAATWTQWAMAERFGLGAFRDLVRGG